MLYSANVRARKVMRAKQAVGMAISFSLILGGSCRDSHLRVQFDQALFFRLMA